VKTDLYTGAGTSAAYAITVTGGSVYVAGLYEAGSTRIACYWKDGVKTDLYNGSSEAYAIIVSGGSVYIAGFYYDGSNKGIACYWKNGVRTDLYNGTGYSYANDMFVVE
jgi:hypothetical protein